MSKIIGSTQTTNFVPPLKVLFVISIFVSWYRSGFIIFFFFIFVFFQYYGYKMTSFKQEKEKRSLVKNKNGDESSRTCSSAVISYKV
jgi:hypothetical protein